LKETAPCSLPAPTRQLERGRTGRHGLIDLWLCTYIVRRLVGSAMEHAACFPTGSSWPPCEGGLK